MADGRAEEREVLQSIYDENELKFTEDYAMEYRLGEAGTFKSLVLKVTWPDGYPDIPPVISLDSFYNGHIPPCVKAAIVQDLNAVASEQLGAALTFSLIDQLRENSEKYFEMIELEHSKVRESEDASVTLTQTECTKAVKKQAKREQLTKAQKRRQLNRLDQNGELPRGWNWVSVVKHLQQNPPEPTV